MFHFSRFPRTRSPWIVTALNRQLGLPIRTSPDQRLLATSPKLFAGYYVLHRLSVSRHPPYALNCSLIAETRMRPYASRFQHAWTFLYTSLSSDVFCLLLDITSFTNDVIGYLARLLQTMGTAYLFRYEYRPQKRGTVSSIWARKWMAQAYRLPLPWPRRILVQKRPHVKRSKLTPKNRIRSTAMWYFWCC